MNQHIIINIILFIENKCSISILVAVVGVVSVCDIFHFSIRSFILSEHFNNNRNLNYHEQLFMKIPINSNVYYHMANKPKIVCVVYRNCREHTCI